MLEVSRATIDHVAGLENGYAAKIFQPKPSKRLGPVSWSMPRVLGLKLIVAVDVEARATLAHRMPPRNAAAARHAAPVTLPPSVDELAAASVRMRMSENGSRGGRARAASLPAKHRSRIARAAARADGNRRATEEYDHGTSRRIFRRHLRMRIASTPSRSVRAIGSMTSSSATDAPTSTRPLAPTPCNDVAACSTSAAAPSTSRRCSSCRGCRGSGPVPQSGARLFGI